MSASGGLGSPAALYLAAAGVGAIGLVDFDHVDLTNLQRQILYGTADVGQPKLDVAEARLRALNPHVAIEVHAEPFGVANARRLVSAYDLVIDGTDNFSTRFLVNDACVLARRPNVYGSVFRFEGQASVFAAPGGPCYRCLHPEPPPAGLIPNCAEAGVLGVLPGVIGMIQATEALKMLAGIGEPLIGKLLLYDALRMRFRQITLPRDPACPVCGDAPTITELTAYDPVACERAQGGRNVTGRPARRNHRPGTSPVAAGEPAAPLDRRARAVRTRDAAGLKAASSFHCARCRPTSTACPRTRPSSSTAIPAVAAPGRRHAPRPGLRCPQHGRRDLGVESALKVRG